MLPYQAGTVGGMPRPLLWVHLRGPNGQEGDVQGLLDTGADTTSMPSGYMALMGYDTTNTAAAEVGQVQGTVHVRNATEPCDAYVGGLDHITFQLRPTFVPGSRLVLWGRSDLMSIFGLLFEEDQQRVSLILPPGT